MTASSGKHTRKGRSQKYVDANTKRPHNLCCLQENVVRRQISNCCIQWYHCKFIIADKFRLKYFFFDETHLRLICGLYGCMILGFLSVSYNSINSLNFLVMMMVWKGFTMFLIVTLHLRFSGKHTRKRKIINMLMQKQPTNCAMFARKCGQKTSLQLYVKRVTNGITLQVY